MLYCLLKAFLIKGHTQPNIPPWETQVTLSSVTEPTLGGMSLFQLHTTHVLHPIIAGSGEENEVEVGICFSGQQSVQGKPGSCPMHTPDPTHRLPRPFPSGSVNPGHKSTASFCILHLTSPKHDMATAFQSVRGSQPAPEYKRSPCYIQWAGREGKKPWSQRNPRRAASTENRQTL